MFRYGARLGSSIVGIFGVYCILLRVVLKLQMHDAIPLLTVGIIGATAGCVYAMRNMRRRWQVVERR